MLCDERIFVADYLALKVCRQTWMVFGQPCKISVHDTFITALPRAPLMRRYPHMNDSRMSTCFTSTSTSYCWRSEVWLPLNRLPGRRSDDDEFGRNCRKYQHESIAPFTRSVIGKGEVRWLADGNTGAGAFAESGEGCDVRCSSAPSSVEVIGVGVSQFGASMLVLGGLV
jgi:hypothetical protein